MTGRGEKTGNCHSKNGRRAAKIVEGIGSVSRGVQCDFRDRFFVPCGAANSKVVHAVRASDEDNAEFDCGGSFRLVFYKYQNESRFDHSEIVTCESISRAELSLIFRSRRGFEADMENHVRPQPPPDVFTRIALTGYR